MNQVTPPKIKEVAQVIMGQSPDSRYYNAEGIGIPFLQGCAQFGRVFPNTSVYCTSPSKIAPKGSILFSVRAPVGEINLADRTYCIGRGLAAVIARDVDASLLYYLLSFVKPLLSQIAQGSTFEAISSTDLKECLLPNLGDAQNQSKIAEVLVTADQAIEQTEALIAKYRRIKTGLMQDLLTRGIDENGNLRDPVVHKFKPSPMGMIPMEWEVSTLGKLAVFKGGHAFGNEELTEFGYKVLRISNLHKADFPYWRYDGSVQEDWVVVDGDLLFSWAGVASSIDCYLYRGEAALLNQHIYNLKITNDDLRQFVYTYLCWLLPALRQEIEGGAGQLHLTKEKIQAIVIPVPDPREIGEINEMVGYLYKLIEQEEVFLWKIRKLKTGLMQDLLTGRVSVAPLLAVDKEEKEAA